MSAGGASGPGTANQVRPPSTVSRSRTVRHVATWSAHGVASSQPAEADTKLADRTVSTCPPRVGEPDRATVSPALAGAEWLAPSAGTGAVRPQEAAATSSAAVITSADHERGALCAACEPNSALIMSGPPS